MAHVQAPWPFRLADPLSVDGNPVAAAEVVAAVGPTLTPERRRRIDEVVAARTFAVAPILEQVADAGNIAAVLRSVEGLGFGGVHLVPAATGGRERPPNRVTQGADKWLLTRSWDSPAACVAGLRAAGLPETYPLDGDGAPVTHPRCQRIGERAKEAGLRGVRALCAQSRDGTGRELAWFPASSRNVARRLRVLKFGKWFRE